MRIALASDHAGFAHKRMLIDWLRASGHQVLDFGAHDETPSDYPDHVRPAAEAVAAGVCERGIVLGGSGNGEAMAANRVPGVRCALCWNTETARLGRAHNDANAMALGARLVSPEDARAIVRVWLETPFEGGRHAGRIAKLDDRGPPADAVMAWRRLESPGHEIARVWHARRVLSGTAVFIYEGAACVLHHHVTCDSKWRTMAASVHGFIGNAPVRVVLSADDQRKWWCNGARCPQVDGCEDIDLGWSPSTNLLPLQRLALPVGASADVRSAWIDVPALLPEALEQRYQRESDTSYAYESEGGRFRAALVVNASGFVTDYGGLFVPAAE